MLPVFLFLAFAVFSSAQSGRSCQVSWCPHRLLPIICNTCVLHQSHNLATDPDNQVSDNGEYCTGEWKLICSTKDDCSCFQYIDTNFTFEIAQKVCQSLGGDLPSIHSEGKNNLIYILSGDVKHGAWIGLKSKNRVFVGIDGKTLRYESWNDAKPRNGASYGNCVHYVGYEDEDYIEPSKWSHSPCTELRPVMCEKPIQTLNALPVKVLQVNNCPENYKEKCFENNVCYCYSVKPSMIWGDGVAICSSEGAYMVSIHSSEENNYIQDIIPNNAWIGRLYNSTYWVDGSHTDYNIWTSSYASYSTGLISKTNGYWYATNLTNDAASVVCKTVPQVQPVTTAQPGPCPENYTEKCFNDNICYCYTVKSKMFWGDGIAICRSEGGDMVSIHSSEENIFVREFGNPAWIGKSYDSTYWVDGTSLSYNNWYPNGFTGHSIGYIQNSGYWYATYGIDYTFKVVCKMPAYSTI
ncbi:macrophage mannose receptor 1-like isoform X1 [Artemia franciscana]|uniref:macrophage mannose receptor 1-like isoform X1 n=1 Tax=Artemia franciscana TaxID=6661 RepID=UPI0032DA52EE